MLHIWKGWKPGWKAKTCECAFFKKPLKEIIKKTKHQATESISYISDKGLVSRLYKT